MKLYMNIDGYDCCILEPEDWETYRNLCPHYAHVIDGAFLHDDLSHPDDSHIVMMKDGAAVGLISVLQTRNSIYIDQVFVVPEHRGQGYSGILYHAALLLAANQTRHRGVTADAARDNPTAIKALKSSGFVQVHGGAQPPAHDYIRFSFNLDTLRSPPAPSGPGHSPC
jgi:GNAT superfamily N-acetyltransferase